MGTTESVLSLVGLFGSNFSSMNSGPELPYKAQKAKGRMFLPVWIVGEKLYKNLLIYVYLIFLYTVHPIRVLDVGSFIKHKQQSEPRSSVSLFL